MTKQFSMTVRHDGMNLYHRHVNKAVFRSQIERYFGETPHGPYRVTFERDRRGNLSLESGQTVLCIWPKGWRIGTRFNRRVKQL